jgi:hypothetical protein
MNHAHGDQVVEPVTLRRPTHTTPGPMLKGQITTAKSEHTLRHTGLTIAHKDYAPLLGEV